MSKARENQRLFVDQTTVLRGPVRFLVRACMVPSIKKLGIRSRALVCVRIVDVFRFHRLYPKFGFVECITFSLFFL